MRSYDVVVAGAGPGGSKTARELAKAGLNVLLLEEHPQIGKPVHCSGLITPRTINEAGIGTWVVQNRITGGVVYSSYGGMLRLGGDRTHALVIDRLALDIWLAQKAEEAGAELALGSRLETIEREGGHLRLGLAHRRGRRTIHAKLLVGADGASSRVAAFLGQRVTTGRIRAIGATVQLPHYSDDDSVRVFAGDSVAPGWFGWLIPQGTGLARLGIGAPVRSSASPRRLMQQMTDRFPAEFRAMRIQSFSGGVIPLYQPIKTYGDNVMLVGDAARQVKPFSGGGIRTALIGARYCAQTAVEALEAGDLSSRFLKRYELRWRGDLGKEFETELRLRTIAHYLNEAQLHNIILWLGHPMVQYFTRHHGDIDFPARLFSRMFRQRTLRQALFNLPFLRTSALEPMEPQVVTCLSEPASAIPS